MELKFINETHTYQSINEPDKQWLSVTGIVKMFKEPFDKETIAVKVSKNKKSKWFGMEPDTIIKCWDGEGQRASQLGDWYHKQREDEVGLCETIRRDGVDLPIIKPLLQDGVKLSPVQQLTSGIYPEHFVYLKSAGICGQADRVEIISDSVDIYDYKTYKKVELEGYTNWDGITKKLKHPLEHLDECNLIESALQLSFYMYIILKHNHQLKPGKMQIHHIIFEKELADEKGNEKLVTDLEGNPVVKEVVPYNLPYLKDEVMTIINYLQNK